MLREFARGNISNGSFYILLYLSFSIIYKIKKKKKDIVKDDGVALEPRSIYSAF